MKWYLSVAWIAITSNYKWILGGMVIAGVLAVSLYASGVIGGGDAGAASPPGSPPAAANAEVTPTLTSTATPSPTPAPSPTPTLAPTPIPAPTKPPALDPSPTPTPEPTPVLPAEIAVPVHLEGAKNIGSLEFVLVYDPAVLQVLTVEPGPLAGAALLEASTQTPGAVWAAVVDANGISGNGAVATITFKVIGEVNSSTRLGLESVAAHDAASLLDIITQKTPGSYTVKDAALSGPSLEVLP